MRRGTGGFLMVEAGGVRTVDVPIGGKRCGPHEEHLLLHDPWSEGLYYRLVVHSHRDGISNQKIDLYKVTGVVVMIPAFRPGSSSYQAGTFECAAEIDSRLSQRMDARPPDPSFDNQGCDQFVARSSNEQLPTFHFRSFVMGECKYRCRSIPRVQITDFAQVRSLLTAFDRCEKQGMRYSAEWIQGLKLCLATTTCVTPESWSELRKISGESGGPRSTGKRAYVYG